MSTARNNATEVFRVLFTNPGRAFTRRELREQVRLIGREHYRLGDALDLLVAKGMVTKTEREGKENVYQAA